MQDIKYLLRVHPKYEGNLTINLTCRVDTHTHICILTDPQNMLTMFPNLQIPKTTSPSKLRLTHGVICAGRSALLKKAAGGAC